MAAKFMTVIGATSPKRAITKRPWKSSPGESWSEICTSNQASSVTVKLSAKEKPNMVDARVRAKKIAIFLVF